MRLILLALGILAFPAWGQAQSETSDEPRVRIVTNLGEIVLRLDHIRAPLTVEAFLKHVDSGHYEGTIFHRVVQGFIAQAGGYTVDMELKPIAENVVNESGNGLSNMRGTVGLARTNEPHSGTTQFYINLADNLDLNPRPTRWGYAVFGSVESGMDLVDQIGHSSTGPRGPFDGSVPIEPVIIERIERLND